MEDNNLEQYEDFMNPKPQRQFMLSFLCVLSFINSVYQTIASLSTFLMYNTMKKMFADEDGVLSDLIEQLGEQVEVSLNAMEALFSVNRFYYLLTAVLFIASFFGVFYMWKLQKRGFHIYTIAQILILICSFWFYYRPTGLSAWSDVVTTVIFVVWYLVFYRRDMR
ncbi:MAG: hypothetical protein ACI358_08355 [Candidatus Limimorpha sp.]